MTGDLLQPLLNTPEVNFIKTLPNTPEVDFVSFRPPFSAICSIGGVPFHGTILVEYRPGDLLLEFISFEDWVKSSSKTRCTIEDVARSVYDVLKRALGDIPIRVTVDAVTTVHAPVSAQKGDWQ